MGGVRRGSGGGPVHPATLALVLDLDRAIANRALTPPALVRTIYAMRIEEKDRVAEGAFAGAAPFTRGGVELLVGRRKERPVYRVEDQRLAGAILANDRQHVTHHIEDGVFVAMPVDQADAAYPGAALPLCYPLAIAVRAVGEGLLSHASPSVPSSSTSGMLSSS